MINSIWCDKILTDGTASSHKTFYLGEATVEKGLHDELLIQFSAHLHGSKPCRLLLEESLNGSDFSVVGSTPVTPSGDGWAKHSGTYTPAGGEGKIVYRLTVDRMGGDVSASFPFLSCDRVIERISA